nr:unnamed protein product [Digitaria exilis]
MATVAAGAGAYEEMLRVVEACAVRIRWRLRPGSKRRLLNACCIMPVRHVNIMLGLQETRILNPLRVMVINDMLYLIHVKGLAEHASPKARSEHQLAFVDVEKSCCELLTNTEENDTVLELVSIQDRFAAKFPVDLDVDMPVIQPGITKQMSGLPERTIDAESTDNDVDNRTLLVVDLSAFLEAAQIALPSLNGWLLGYPVTYLFCNGSAEAAIQNLSKHSLHIYRVYVCGSCQPGTKQSEDELMR